MQEIDERFYELLPAETKANPSHGVSANHPYDVDWNIYDSLRPNGQSIVKEGDRKSTRLNSSHVAISYAVFCLKKKKKNTKHKTDTKQKKKRPQSTRLEDT